MCSICGYVLACACVRGCVCVCMSLTCQHVQGQGIRSVSYERHELLSSDHRPVSALFDVQVKKCNHARRREVRSVADEV